MGVAGVDPPVLPRGRTALVSGACPRWRLERDMPSAHANDRRRRRSLLLRARIQVPDSERTLVGPLHKGFYRGHCLAGDDILEAVMTIEEAIEWASKNPQCYGFTYNSADKDVRGPIRIWFKSKLNVLYNESWWTYSTGLGME